MKKVVYFGVFRYGPRDITLVCTEIQKKLFVQYILCGIYYFMPVDCMDVICMVRIGKNIVMWISAEVFFCIDWHKSKILQFCVCQMKKYMHLELVALNI